MMPFNRPAAPVWLASKWKIWGKSWQRRLRAHAVRKRKAIEAAKKKKKKLPIRLAPPAFFWPKIKTVPINQKIVPILASANHNHCSFCDGHPLGPQSPETIEHYLSKVKHPLRAFEWGNLFLSCVTCQGAKSDKMPASTIRPDAIGYSFRKHFNFDALTGEVIPNPQTSISEQEDADNFIKLYGLNEEGRPLHRADQLVLFQSSPNFPVNRRPYRFMFFP